MTEEQNKLAELVALSEKATQGEWRNLRHYSKIAAKQMFPAKRLHASYARLIPVGKMVSRARDGKGKANGDFVVALVNWFRANHATLRHELVPEGFVQAVPDPLGRTMCTAQATGQWSFNDREPATEAVLELVKRAADTLERGSIFKPIHCPECLNNPSKSPLAGGFTINDRQELGMARCHACGHRWQTIMRDPLIDELRAALKGKGASQGDEERIYTKADMEAACALVLAGYRSKPMLDKMVDRFLAWPLPFSVCADLIATRQEHGRIGTNLLTAIEARQMLEHVLAATPDEQKG